MNTVHHHDRNKEWAVGTVSKLSPMNDPWDPIGSLKRYGEHRLTSVEMTVAQVCNMRCEHCAVGHTLIMREPNMLPLDLMLKKLDQVRDLETISITGGEPTFHMSTVKDYIIPILKYARERGIRSQLNSNVTLDYARYEMIAPYLDVMHISFNYTNAMDFHEVGFVHSNHQISSSVTGKWFDQMMENTRKLTEGGLLVSAESMINYRTHHKLGEIHRLIDEMGCQRHEVHPMYPSSFASSLPVLSIDNFRQSINQLLDVRNKEMWMLFGTLPFYGCSTNPEDHTLLKRLYEEPNVTVRNDPDGRNRLNVNMFNGEVYVTDFADIPSFGSIYEEELDDIFNRWLSTHPLAQSVNCHCPSAACCGPNLLVANMYYPNVDFKNRQSNITLG
ncbi:radical SAM/CxCxxxxC motif protein YfkAB [Paenibacillus aquistagni]|uniref:radical SAM/CxCxxxxC motif protein YfkAB n=1 Tax=Paenibacillus aquistagni TaxID=1852522 RepID=UPI000B5133DB|nr:radical SAM/CxCxxxxC motif protein YfkAB [Paenibacillus aquistagni]